MLNINQNLKPVTIYYSENCDGSVRLFSQQIFMSRGYSNVTPKRTKQNILSSKKMIIEAGFRIW